MTGYYLPFLVDVLEGGHPVDGVPVLLELRRDAPGPVREEVLQKEERFVGLPPLPPVEAREAAVEDVGDPDVLVDLERLPRYEPHRLDVRRRRVPVRRLLRHAAQARTDAGEPVVRVNERHGSRRREGGKA